MRISPLLAPLAIVLEVPVYGTDPYCPAYPASQRTALLQSEAKRKAFRAFSAARAAKKANAYPLTDDENVIDRYIFGKMQADGVAPAARSSDPEFLRRVYLDLTGRLPTVEQATQFLSDSDSNKRTALIDKLLASDTYIDKWTMFFGNLFQVTSGYYNCIFDPIPQSLPRLSAGICSR